MLTHGAGIDKKYNKIYALTRLVNHSGLHLDEPQLNTE